MSQLTGWAVVIMCHSSVTFQNEDQPKPNLEMPGSLARLPTALIRCATQRDIAGRSYSTARQSELTHHPIRRSTATRLGSDRWQGAVPQGLCPFADTSRLGTGWPARRGRAPDAPFLFPLLSAVGLCSLS